MLEFTPIAGGGVRVRTERDVYEAGQIIVSAGAWVGELVPGLSASAVPERQVLGWFQPKRPDAVRTRQVSGVQPEERSRPLLSVPGLERAGLQDRALSSPARTGRTRQLSREPTPADEQALRRGLAEFFPDADGDVLALRTCMFTNTPDEHFIIDRLPGFEEVIVASPCSGHGFKFSSAIGEILADLATARASNFDLSLFSLRRFQV